MKISKLLNTTLITVAAILIASCGQDTKNSEVDSEQVLIKLPAFMSMKFETSDIVAFSKGEEDTKFGKKVRQIDRIPGVSVKEEDVIEALVDELELNKDAIALADKSDEGIELLKDFSEYVYSKDKKGEIEDSVVALQIASQDNVGSIVELVEVWPAKRVDVNILKIMNNEDDFQRILDGLNDLNSGKK
jgi:hypothetical protein